MGFRYIKGDWKDFYDAPDEAMLLVVDSYHRQYFVDIFPEAGGKYWSYLSSHGKWGAGVKPEDFTVLAVRERIAEWDGEGLPPVGCECMVRGEIGDNGWYKCKVIAHTFFGGYNCAVFQTDSTVSCSSDGNFRPIRSEADKKRDEAILQLSHSLRANGSVTEEQLCRLYSDIAAGYIPHIRID